MLPTGRERRWRTVTTSRKTRPPRAQQKLTPTTLGTKARTGARSMQLLFRSKCEQRNKRKTTTMKRLRSCCSACRKDPLAILRNKKPLNLQPTLMRHTTSTRCKFSSSETRLLTSKITTSTSALTLRQVELPHVWQARLVIPKFSLRPKVKSTRKTKGRRNQKLQSSN